MYFDPETPCEFCKKGYPLHRTLRSAHVVNGILEKCRSYSSPVPVPIRTKKTRSHCRVCNKPITWLKGWGLQFPYDLVQGELRRHHCEPIDGARDPITEKRLEKAKAEKKARGRTEWKEAV